MGPAGARRPGGSSLAQQLQGMHPAEAARTTGARQLCRRRQLCQPRPPAPGRPRGPAARRAGTPSPRGSAPIDPNAVGQMAPGPRSYGGFGGGGVWPD